MACKAMRHWLESSSVLHNFMNRQWGNLEGCFHGELLTQRMWNEVNRVSIEFFKSKKFQNYLDLRMRPSPLFRKLAGLA
jgi:hypothetical protein